MAELPGTARVAVIGGSDAGASYLHHLARAGLTRYAADDAPTFPAGWSAMNMQRCSAELCRGLAATVECPMNYHVTGSIRLAHSGS